MPEHIQEPLIAVVERVPEGFGPIRLPPHATLDACPKCGQEKLYVTHHEGIHLAAPCGRVYGAEAQKRDWEFPEHLCITCSGCRYGFVTQVALPG